MVGYQIYYWYNNISSLGVDQYYTWTEWQTGTVTGLIPDTEYQFNISVYRQWQGGEKYIDPYWAYSGSISSPLVARTAGIYVRYKYIYIDIYTRLITIIDEFHLQVMMLR